MVAFGYTLSSEEHAPCALVVNARRAEEVGFDFASISDHYHPWVEAQGHSGFVWSVLGAIAAATERLPIGVGVTCPTFRIHPAVLAQATATTSLLLGDRFFWGVGSGEALNEHVLGDRWPRPEVRLAMLEESLEIVRRLWARETVHRVWLNAGVPGQLAQDLPTWTHFELAAQLVAEEDVVASTPCGPDVGPVLESVRTYLDAGYDHLYFHQIGPDQEGFFGFWERELAPALADLRA